MWTLDQQIQAWNAVGTWVAGFGTLTAVIVALYLARRSERVRANCNVGIMVTYAGDGTPAEEHLGFTVTNLGMQPLTINSIGWRIGKGKSARYCIQPVRGQNTANYPKVLAHGEQAAFLVSFTTMPNWPKDFATGFIEDLSEENLRTLRAQVHTSVGKTIDVVPAHNVLEILRKAVAEMPRNSDGTDKSLQK